MRLIDADLLKKNCKCTGRFDDSFQCVSLATLSKVINNQPTAYDVDKVVEQLGKWTVNAKIEMVEGIFKNYDIINAETVIEIVKEGGVE